MTLHTLNSSLDSVKLLSCVCADKLHVQGAAAGGFSFLYVLFFTVSCVPAPALATLWTCAAPLFSLTFQVTALCSPGRHPASQQQQLQASCEYNAATPQHTACTIIVYVMGANGQIIEIEGEVTFFCSVVT